MSTRPTRSAKRRTIWLMEVLPWLRRASLHLVGSLPVIWVSHVPLKVGPTSSLLVAIHALIPLVLEVAMAEPWIAPHARVAIATSGLPALTLVARSCGSRFLMQMQAFRVAVPPGHGPGKQFHANINGQLVAVTVPQGVQPGQQLQIQVPGTQPRRAEL